LDNGALADLHQELRQLLLNWDPIGVGADAPDECDYLTGPLLSRLAGGADEAEISEYLWLELDEHLGVDPVLAESDRFGTQVVTWFRIKQTPPRR
jgi:hypothetical protein